MPGLRKATWALILSVNVFVSVVILAALGAKVVSAPRVTLNPPSPASFTGPVTDQGVDSGNNGLYDVLRVQTGLTVNEGGTYVVTGGLWHFAPGNSGSPDLNLTTTTFVGVDDEEGGQSYSSGTYTVTLDFSGRSVYRTGRNGTWSVGLSLFSASGSLLDGRLHTTASYAYTSFDLPDVRFQAYLGDYGVDTDQDGYFEQLVSNVTVDVVRPGTYAVQGGLYNATQTSLISWVSDTHEFPTTGLHTVSLTFTIPDECATWTGPYPVQWRLPYVSTRGYHDEAQFTTANADFSV